MTVPLINEQTGRSLTNSGFWRPEPQTETSPAIGPLTCHPGVRNPGEFHLAPAHPLGPETSEFLRTRGPCVPSPGRAGSGGDGGGGKGGARAKRRLGRRATRRRRRKGTGAGGMTGHGSKDKFYRRGHRRVRPFEDARDRDAGAKDRRPRVHSHPRPRRPRSSPRPDGPEGSGGR